MTLGEPLGGQNEGGEVGVLKHCYPPNFLPLLQESENLTRQSVLLAGHTICCRLHQSHVLTALTTASLLSPKLLLCQVGGLASLIFLPAPTALCSNKLESSLQACQREKALDSLHRAAH